MMRARGTAAFDCAPYKPKAIRPSCRPPTCRHVDQLGQSRQACRGQGFLRRLAYLDLAFPKREITVFLPLVRTPSHLARSLRDRVGCHAWQQLGATGTGVYGARSTWRSRVRPPSREGIFKGNHRFPLERRLFWYFSLAVERKVHKNKYQTDRQIQI